MQQNGDRSQEDDMVLDEVTVQVRSCHVDVVPVFPHLFRARHLHSIAGHPSHTQRKAESERPSCNDSQDTQQLEFPGTTPSN